MPLKLSNAPLGPVDRLMTGQDLQGLEDLVGVRVFVRSLSTSSSQSRPPFARLWYWTYQRVLAEV